MHVCTGVQLAKLTPFRSFVVTTIAALTLTIMAILQFRGGAVTYVIVSHLHSPIRVSVLCT